MIRKEVIAEVKAVSGKERTLEFTGSTETRDRVGDIIEVAGWQLKNYKTNPVFMWAHRYGDPPIGKATRVWKSEGKLKFHIEFADAETYEFADTIYKLYQGGFLSAVSVGFEPIEWEDIEQKGDSLGRGTRFKKQDLLELSAVPVPANAEALMNAREAGVITTKQLEAITKPEETEDYIRVPVAECKITATIDISKDEGIKALYCGKEKKVATYLFEKAKGWTMAKAKKWVEEHKKSLHIVEVTTTGSKDIEYMATEINDDIVITRATADPIDGKFEACAIISEDNDTWMQKLGQESLKDELDYIRAWIRLTGLNDEAKEFGWELIREILRLAGDDIPDDIFKVGAVLNAKNRGDLNEAKRRIDNVLNSAGNPEEPEKPKSLWDKAGLRLKP